MKKRNITLCAVAMLCMQGYAKADTFTLKGDNTCVENYAQRLLLTRAIVQK